MPQVVAMPFWWATQFFTPLRGNFSVYTACLGFMVQSVMKLCEICECLEHAQAMELARFKRGPWSVPWSSNFHLVAIQYAMSGAECCVLVNTSSCKHPRWRISQCVHCVPQT